MKIIRIIIVLLLTVSVSITILFGKAKIGEEISLVEQKEYKGIITVWHIDGFEGGSGSRKQFLLKMSREFEKQNSGVLVMVINHTFSSLKEGIDKGNYPDIISYSNGAEVNGMQELNLSRAVVGGKIGGKVYATAWCRGGYVLIKNSNALDKRQNTIIVSQAEFTQPLLAMALEGLEFDNIEVHKPMDAYVKFTSNKYTYFLGTQRDVVRLSNRGMEVECVPLTAFNDLYQYMALTCTDSMKSVYARRFIEFIISDSVQAKLNEICMLSPYIQVVNQIETLNGMQNLNDFKSISCFSHHELLKEIQDLSLSILKGSKEDINKIKNLLI